MVEEKMDNKIEIFRSSFADLSFVDEHPADRCAYCQLDTGRQHQESCPFFQLRKYQRNLRLQGRVRIFKYDDKGNFMGEL